MSIRRIIAAAVIAASALGSGAVAAAISSAGAVPAASSQHAKPSDTWT